MKNLKAEPFSTKELEKSGSRNIKEPLFFISEGNARIAYFPYIAKKEKANLILIHGGGAHSTAGYQNIAEGLEKKFNISTYMMDLRGHGLSGDKRGDAEEVEFVYKDIRKLIELVGSGSDNPVFLCGHSSGAGVILNYLSYQNTGDLSGIIFISPQFGYKSKTGRDNINESFAKVRTWVFVLSAMSGKKLFSHTTAVYFNYPQELLDKDKLLLSSYTTNMAYACTPDKPMEQFKKIDKPVLIIIGENDELIDPEKLKGYMPLLPADVRSRSDYRIVKDAGHLSVLLECDGVIGEWVKGRMKE